MLVLGTLHVKHIDKNLKIYAFTSSSVYSAQLLWDLVLLYFPPKTIFEMLKMNLHTQNQSKFLDAY